VASLRDPGSLLDEAFPAARVDDRLFRGTGTSVASGVASGAVALLLSQRSWLSPDQVKDVLRRSADELPGVPRERQGRGALDVRGASRLNPSLTLLQLARRSSGSGSLQASRGSHAIEDRGRLLEGETDIFGRSWARSDTAASSGMWVVTSWGDTVAAAWDGEPWLLPSWSGAAWDAPSSTREWAAEGWSPGAWDNDRFRSWSAWSGNSWSGNSWSGNSWSQHWSLVAPVSGGAP
jgi:serine protease AprX